MKSESIKELATALAKAQQEMKHAHKDADNPFFKSKYADLSSVWAACKDSLNNNGLSVVQGPQFENNQVFLETVLLHTSGEWISTRCPLINPKGDMQGLGSALSYSRRYGLAAICGVVADSDDDAEGTKLPEKKTQPQPMKSVSHPFPPMVQTSKPGDYVCKVKKFQGKKLSELKDFEILGYIDWLKANVAHPFPDQAEFMNEGQKYLDYLNKKHPSEPPPVYDDLLDLPWPETK